MSAAEKIDASPAYIASQFDLNTLMTSLSNKYYINAFNMELDDPISCYSYVDIEAAVKYVVERQHAEKLELRKVVKTREEQISEISTEASESRTVQDRLETTVNSLRDRNLRLKGQLEEAQAKADNAEIEANRKAGDFQGEIDKLNKQIHERIGAHKKLEKGQKSESDEIAKLRKENKRLKEQVNRLKSKSGNKPAKASTASNINTLFGGSPTNKQQIEAMGALLEEQRLHIRELKKGKESYTRETFSSCLHSLWDSEEAQVLFMDRPLLIRSDGGKELHQYTLLYTNKRGNYSTYCMNANKGKEGQFLISSGLDFPEGTSQAEKTRASKYEVSIPKNIAEAMEAWLIKVNTTQNGELHDDDFDLVVN